MSNLQELAAFNDELVSLAQAGIPVDLGLSQLSHDPDDANKQINAALTQSVEGGSSLADAVSENRSLPPVYQSVVGAGLRCGRLPVALEALSRYSQSQHDVGQSLRSALVYPLIICGLAYLLFVGTCLFVPLEDYQQLGKTESGGGTVFHTVLMLRESLPLWVAVPPVLLAILLFIAFRSNGIPKILGWFPAVSDVKTDQRYASLADLLALLVEHDVPLHEGLQLAARASGDAKLTSAAQIFATNAGQGQALTQDAQAAQQFPPFLRWALTSPMGSNDLCRALKLAAETYRNRAERRTKWLRTVPPMLTCVFVAGGITLLYCLSVFMPFIHLMKDLS